MRRLSVLSVLMVVTACAGVASAATLYVGPTRSAPDYTYIQAGINAAADGDTVLVDPATYMGADGTMFISDKHNLTVRGNGGRPVLDLTDGQDWSDPASVWQVGICLIRGTSSNITIDNLEFLHAGERATTKTYNASCIRVNAGVTGTITVRNCVMREGQGGFMDAASTTHNWDIQNCIFHDLGDTRASGITHNLYLITSGTLTFKYNWSYNCQDGYCLKTRMPVNYIMYNRLGDEQGKALIQMWAPLAFTHGGGAVDIPNGGLSYVIGNVLQDTVDAADGRILKYGEEGITAGHNTQLYAVYNTILGRRGATVTGFELHGNDATPAYLANNFLVHDGAGQLVTGSIVNNSVMINSNLALYEHQGMSPPAMHRFMYDANTYDCGDAPGAGNHGTANTYDNWDVLNVRPIDPNTFPYGKNCSNTTSKMPLTGYQTLLGLALLPGSNPLALPATGSDGTSLLATGQFGSMPYVAGSTPTSETRLNGNDIGAYGPAGISNHQPVGTITSALPPFIYEGMAVNLTATATDQDAGQVLSYQWTQMAGQGQTLTAPTALSTSFTVAAKSLNSRSNETLTFQFVATDNGSPVMSSTPVTASVTCYVCGDIDHDQAVILADLKLLVAAWNSVPGSGSWNLAADLDGSSSVNLGDLKLLVANWNRSLP